MEGDKGTVCVTGGTGYVGSWLIKVLLEQGYSVHTTVRPDPGNKRDLSFLTNLPGADKRLKIFTAVLDHPESFDAAIKGCKGVFHVAAPVEFDDKEPVEVMTQRSINGAVGILKSCLKSETVKKVVFTSSIAAVNFNKENVDMMDESYWTDVDYVRSELDSYVCSYAISKTLTEKAVNEFAAEHGLDLVTVIPPMVLGPFICPKMQGSVRSALGPILGEKIDSLLVNISMVHIDDLSRALIFLLEHPEAKGRYNCSSDTVTFEKIVEILSTRYPEYKLPESLAIEGTKLPGLSSNKLLDLGFKFKYGVEDMYDGAIKSCKEKGFL